MIRSLMLFASVPLTAGVVSARRQAGVIIQSMPIIQTALCQRAPLVMRT
jgi:hypothetical protein